MTSRCSAHSSRANNARTKRTRPAFAARPGVCRKRRPPQPSPAQHPHSSLRPTPPPPRILIIQYVHAHFTTCNAILTGNNNGCYCDSYIYIYMYNSRPPSHRQGYYIARGARGTGVNIVYLREECRFGRTRTQMGGVRESLENGDESG